MPGRNRWPLSPVICGNAATRSSGTESPASSIPLTDWWEVPMYKTTDEVVSAIRLHMEAARARGELTRNYYLDHSICMTPKGRRIIAMFLAHPNRWISQASFLGGHTHLSVYM